MTISASNDCAPLTYLDQQSQVTETNSTGRCHVVLNDDSKKTLSMCYIVDQPETRQFLQGLISFVHARTRVDQCCLGRGWIRDCGRLEQASGHKPHTFNLPLQLLSIYTQKIAQPRLEYAHIRVKTTSAKSQHF